MLLLTRYIKNTGYVGGVNKGLSQANKSKPDYLLVMNNDTLIDKKAINVLVNTSKEYNEIKKVFNKSKIQLNYFWKPLHLQKPYKKYLKSKISYTNKIWNRIILLPSHPGVTFKNQQKILNILKNLQKS